jgi:hypothetical protein
MYYFLLIFHLLLYNNNKMERKFVIKPKKTFHVLVDFFPQ